MKYNHQKKSNVKFIKKKLPVMINKHEDYEYQSRLHEYKLKTQEYYNQYQEIEDYYEN